MASNLTILQEADTMGKIAIYANNASNGILMGGFMIAIFFVMMFVLKRWDFDDALLSSSFVCFILSSILAYSKLLNIIFPLGFLAITAFTALYVFVAKR